MAIRPILAVANPRLRMLSTPVKSSDDGLRTLIAEMFERMYAVPGIGRAS